MPVSDFKKGDKVKFTPGPRSTGPVTATVTGNDGSYLITKDDKGFERKARPGSCTKVAA